jgi:DNA ligase-1
MNFVEEHKIGKEEFTTTSSSNKEGKDVHDFPPLYKQAKTGKVTYWKVWVVEDTYFRESGYVGGAPKGYPGVKCSGKNIGKSNQTTPHQQALLEANSEWKHKLKQLYSPKEEATSVEKATTTQMRPMLAEVFSKHKHKLKYPVGVSKKMDGVRCMIYPDDGKVMIISRLGTVYENLNGIRKDAEKIFARLPIVLDGELYSHTTPFTIITGATRSKTISKHDALIEFHVFDYYDASRPDEPYKARVERLKEIQRQIRTTNIKFCFYDLAEDEKQIKQLHDQYVTDGYEGVIVRQLEAKYTLGRRTVAMLKYKEFKDEEFEIVDVEEGKGTEEGAAVFVCKYDAEQTFSVRPRGSIELRRAQFQKKDLYIGKKLTVRYQPVLNEKVLPRFPVGIKVAETKKVKVDELVFEAVEVRDYE